MLVDAAQPANVTNAAEQVNDSHNYQNSYWPLVKTVLPAVVNVSVDKTEKVTQSSATPFDDPQMQKFFERFFGQQMPMPEQQQQQQKPERLHGEGSGFVVDPSGYIVTNAHVAGGADKITVALQDGKSCRPSSSASTRRPTWLCSRSRPRKPLPFVEFGDSSKVRVGDKVLADRQPVRPRRHRDLGHRLGDQRARSAPAPMTTSCRSMRRSTAATPAARPSTSTAR